MGLYDRDYYQEEERARYGGGGFAGGRTIVVNLILINAAVFVAELFDPRVSEILSLKPDVFQRPWLFWQLLTYGFVHDPTHITHILFNMIGLWVFGSDVETVYGKAEFLRIYLTAVIVAGLAWALTTAATGGGPLLGASGGIMCLMMLFVMHFPRRLLYIWGVIPVPAWVLGTLFVLVDVLSIGNNDLVAHVAHLAGAAFGFIYFRTGWNLGRLTSGRFSLSSWRSFRLKPRLRVHKPEDEAVDLNRQVDRILEKISREGESSLTKSERRTLEDASRRYQRKRQ
ncbi:MAG: rhomboid family intramembrane serine protease [Pirellulales bacterium]